MFVESRQLATAAVVLVGVSVTGLRPCKYLARVSAWTGVPARARNASAGPATPGPRSDSAISMMTSRLVV